MTALARLHRISPGTVPRLRGIATVTSRAGRHDAALAPDPGRPPHAPSSAPGGMGHARHRSWPIEPEQSVWVTCRSTEADETRVEAAWRYNEGENSSWRAEISPLPAGAVVHYRVHARSPVGEVTGPAG